MLTTSMSSRNPNLERLYEKPVIQLTKVEAQGPESRYIPTKLTGLKTFYCQVFPCTSCSLAINPTNSSYITRQSTAVIIQGLFHLLS